MLPRSGAARVALACVGVVFALDVAGIDLDVHEFTDDRQRTFPGNQRDVLKEPAFQLGFHEKCLDALRRTGRELGEAQETQVGLQCSDDAAYDLYVGDVMLYVTVFVTCPCADLVVEVVPVELREQRDESRRLLPVGPAQSLVSVETTRCSMAIDPGRPEQPGPSQLHVEARRVAAEGALHHGVEVTVLEAFGGRVVVSPAVTLVSEYERLRVLADQVVQTAHGFRSRHAVMCLQVPLAFLIDGRNAIDYQERAVEGGHGSSLLCVPKGGLWVELHARLLHTVPLTIDRRR